MSWSLGREVKAANAPASGVTSFVITLGAQAANVPVGNALVVVMDAAGAHPATGVSTTSSGLSGISVLSSSDASGGQSTATVIVAVVTGTLSSADTITVTFAAATRPSYWVCDFANNGGSVTALSSDKTSVATQFGSTTPSSGTTATLAGADDLIIGNIGFDDGLGTGTFTPATLSPAWNASTTVNLLGAGSAQHTFRWRSPGSTAGVAFAGTLAPSSDYCAQVVAIKPTLAAASSTRPSIYVSREAHRRSTRW